MIYLWGHLGMFLLSWNCAVLNVGVFFDPCERWAHSFFHHVGVYLMRGGLTGLFIMWGL